MGKLTNLNPSPPIADLPYLPQNPTGIEFGVADANYIDFHVNPSSSALDYDVRFMASEGINQPGRGKLALQANWFDVIAKFSINGGAQLVRLLSASITIDLPSVVAGGVAEINRTIVGAGTGDIAMFIPTEMPAGLPYFNINSVIIGANSVRIYFHNLSSGAVDVPSFSGRLLVFGF